MLLNFYVVSNNFFSVMNSTVVNTSSVSIFVHVYDYFITTNSLSGIAG